MATPVFACGFECGVFGASAHIASVSGTPSYSTSTFRTGLRSLQINPSATANELADYLANVVAATRIFVGRVYVRFATLPSANCALIFFSTASQGIGVGFQASDSTLRTVDFVAGTFGASGVVVTTGVWYRVDYKVDTSANPWTADAQIDGTAVGQTTIAVAAATPLAARLGSSALTGTHTADVFYDDLLVSQTAGDYPLGPGTVEAVTVTSDGSHNVAGANDFERTLTGTDINNATTTAYQLIDDLPLESVAGDWINLIAPPNATDYVECIFGTASETRIPLSVEVIYGAHAQAAGTNNLRVALVDSNGATQADVASNSVGQTALLWRRKHFTTIPGGGAWTSTAYQNLRMRCYTNDAAPDPYLDGIILETAFAPVTTSISGVVAEATADAPSGAVQIARSVSGEVATATADTLIPAIIGVGPYLIAANPLTTAAGAAATSVTTASISPGANRLVLCLVSNRKPGTSVPTVSGGGMTTWTQIATTQWQASNDQTLTLFRALESSPGSGTVTVDFGADTQERISVSIVEFSGVDTSGTNGSGAVVQNVATNSNPNDITQNTDWTVSLSALADAANRPYGGFTASGDTGPGTGMTQINEQQGDNTTSVISLWIDSHITDLKGRVTNQNARMGAICIEIKAAPPVSTTVSGAVAAADADVLSGTVLIARAVPGAVATAAADALTGTVTAVRIVSITGTVATTNADIPVSSIAVQIQTSITGSVAVADTDALIPTVTALVGGISVSGEAATASASAEAATITAVRITSIAGEAANASAVIEVATLTAHVDALISGEAALAGAAAESSIVTTVRNVSISVVAATADADANSPTISTVRSISVPYLNAVAIASALAPTITALPSALISGAVAAASSAITEAEVHIGRTIAATTAAANAAAYDSVITTILAVTVAGVRAAADATVATVELLIDMNFSIESDIENDLTISLTRVLRDRPSRHVGGYGSRLRESL